VIGAGPTIPHPERHPYCEFGTIISGEGIEFVEREEAVRAPGDVFLAGPGVPHWFEVTKYPIRFVTVHFLPSLLVDMGPESDGVRLLHRFAASQPLQSRLVRPAAPLRRAMSAGFAELVREFDGSRFGREMRLRCVLMEMLVKLLRAERPGDLTDAPLESAVEWEQINRALRHLQARFAEPVYSRDVAAAAGVSESKLKALFRQTLGMTWVHYLQSYRIHRAVALLIDPSRSVLDVALDVGFESLSHFNTTFRAFMGMSPTSYFRQTSGGGTGKPTSYHPARER
jgi:AraC-like DNA-binding protein